MRPQPRQGRIAVVILASLCMATAAHAQGIAYSVTPTINYLRWDDQLGVSQTYLFGGRLSFDFGSALSLGGYYLTGRDAETDAEAAFPGMAYTDGELDLRHYGADVTINLASASFVPFLRGGGGVLRFQPAEGRRTDQVVLKAGGGLRVSMLPGIEAELFAEDWIFRLNRHTLFTSAEALPPDPDADELRHNLVLGLGLRIPLGGDADHRADWLRGPALAIEPYLGRLRFDDDLALADQNLLGVRTGLDLTRHVGLRGYYWRGMSSDFVDTEPVQSYGGEVQFNLNTGPGVSPFLVGGLGRLDFRSGFTDELANPRSDETMLILGGGVSLGLSERLRVNVALRDHMISGGALQDASRVEDLSHNWLLSAGLTFNVGGSTAPARRVQQPDEALRGEVERLRLENERLRQERERLVTRAGEEREALARVAEEHVVAEEESGIVVREIDGTERVREVHVQEAGRQITLPIPTTGEIIIRYGGQNPVQIEREIAVAPMRVDPRTEEGATLSAVELRTLVRDAVAEELAREGLASPATLPPGAADPARAASPALTEERLAEMERRLADRLEEIVLWRRAAGDPIALQQPLRRDDELASRIAAERRIDLLEQQLMARVDLLVERRLREELERQRLLERRELEGSPLPFRSIPPPPGPAGIAPPVGPAPATRPGARAPRTLDPDRTRAYSGVTFGSPQAVLGARLDFGSVSEGVPLDLVPEIALGFGDGSSLLLAGNLQYDLGLPLTTGSPVTPFVNGGLGLHTSEGLVLNLGYGFHTDLGGTQWGTVTGFAEHHGIDMYRIHRLLVGVRLGL